MDENGKLQETDVMDALDAIANLLRTIADNQLDATVSAGTAKAALEKLAIARHMAFNVIWEYYGDGYMSGMEDTKTDADAAATSTASDANIPSDHVYFAYGGRLVTEGVAASIIKDYGLVLTGIQNFFDARPEVRKSFPSFSNVDETLIAYATRLEKELAETRQRTEKAEASLHSIQQIVRKALSQE